MPEISVIENKEDQNSKKEELKESIETTPPQKNIILETIEDLELAETLKKEAREYFRWNAERKADMLMLIELLFSATIFLILWKTGVISGLSSAGMSIGVMFAEFVSTVINDKSLFNNLVVTPTRAVYGKLSTAKESEELVIVESKEKSLATQTTVTPNQNSNTKESEELVTVKNEEKSLLSKFFVNPVQNLYAKLFTPKESREVVLVKIEESLVTRFVVNPMQNFYARFVTAKKSAATKLSDEESPLLTSKKIAPINQSYQSMNTGLGGPSTKSTSFIIYDDEDEDKNLQDSSSSQSTSSDTISQQPGTQAVYSKGDPLEIKCEV